MDAKIEGRIRFSFSSTIDVREDEVGYIASCPALDVHSQGNTREEAVENVKDAVRLFISSCFNRGCLDQALKDLGFRQQIPEDIQRDKEPLPPPQPLHTIHVPIDLVSSDGQKEYAS